MKLRLCVLIAMVATLFMAAGCNGDADTDTTTLPTVEDLHGEWEVEAATRNGRATGTLNGAVFSFTRDGRLTTNLTGEDDSGAFTLTEMAIQHAGSEGNTYHIADMTDSTMQLHTRLRGMDFSLGLKRSEE